MWLNINGKVCRLWASVFMRFVCPTKKSISFVVCWDSSKIIERNTYGEDIVDVTYC